MFVTHLSCWACGAAYAPNALLNLCTCGKPLKVEYDLAAVGRAVSPQQLLSRAWNLWRYREVLPLAEGVEPPTLGEGGTPLVPADALGEEVGMKAGRLLIKDEAVNPTGSFK